jgi:glycosyltransferase 2 family protein
VSLNLKAQNYRKYLEFAALCLLASVLLWWFGRNLDWAQVRRAVSNSNPYLLILATLIISVAYLVRACRWGALLRPITPSRVADLFAATTIGFTALLLVGRAGEVVRPVVLPMRDPRIRPSASIVTIMIERIYDLMAIILLFAVNLLWFKPPASLLADFARIRLVGIGLLLAGVCGIVLLVWFRRKSSTVIGVVQRLLERWQFVPKRISKLVIGTLEQLARALRVLVNFRELAETIGWTVLLWLGVAFANMLVIRAFGVPFGLSESIFVLGFSVAGSLVPTPGGAAGAFHAATAGAFILLGIDTETAAAISIFLHIIDFGPAAIFGFFYLLRGDLNLSKLRALTSSESVEHVVEEEDFVPEQRLVKADSFGNVVGD